MNILIFLIILLVLVVSHEFGHFIVAKKAGIRVDEFAFGMKPRIASIKKGETEYSINALPIGGYVKIFGENPDEESLHGPDKKRSFVNKPRYIQAAVLLAGVVMNFLVAWLLLSVSLMVGVPTSVSEAQAGAVIQNPTLTITSVLPNSPAQKNGLQIGDEITFLKSGKDTTETPSVESLRYFVKVHGTDPITIDYVRGTEQKEVTLTPESGIVDATPAIGISMDMIGTLKAPFFKSIKEGLILAWNITAGTAIGFYHLIRDAVLGHGSLAGLTGPVGIVGIVGTAAKFGFSYLLSFSALISVNLAVINLVPFPALDGGRLLFLLIEKIKGSRIKPGIANLVNTIGFAALMLLMVVLTYRDVLKLF